MLELEGVEAGYGGSQVLFGLSLSVGAGEAVVLLGRNGMGKTTAIRAIMGMLPVRAGRIRLEGQDTRGWPGYRIARAGLGLVPEGRQVFPNLTVRENLVATAAAPRGGLAPWTLDRVFALFPGLAERRDRMGTELSGGEQQMLAIGRALMTNPRLLLLDEATEGLAPLVRRDIYAVLALLKAEGQAILLVDKNVEALSRVADRHYVIEKGRVVWTGDSAALRLDAASRLRYLGVTRGLGESWRQPPGSA